MKKLIKTALLTVLSGSLLTAATAEKVFTFHRIPAASNPTTPMRISEDGKHIVGSTTNKPFCYFIERDSVYTWSANEGVLWDVSNTGRICGQVKNAAGFKEAVYIDLPSTEFNFLGGTDPDYVPTSSGISMARSITNDGRFIAGHRCRVAGTAKIYETARWELNQGSITLTGLAPDATKNCTTYDISEDGSTLVGWQMTAQKSPAVWTNGVQTTLENGGVFYGLTADGSIAIGGYNTQMASWNAQTGFSYHGKLAGDLGAEGLDIAADGMIVGISTKTNVRTAVVWTAATGLVKFSDYLISLGAVIPEGWDFFNLNSVTPDGKIFTGYGYVPGYTGFSGWYVKIEEVNDISANNALSTKDFNVANYPNPFNPTTNISYKLSAMSDVKLSVFNARGELVNKLVNGSQIAGNYSVKFNGSQLNSGVYFYRLETQSGSLTKKILLCK